jgi:hypothetical protein
MDPLGFGRIIADKWGIVMMHLDVCAAIFGLGLILGWALVRVLLNERLSRQQLRITDLQAVVDGKLPPHFLPPAKRNKLMSFPLVLGGLGLAFIGLAIATIGIFWQSGSQKPQQPTTPRTSDAAPTKPTNLLPDDGGPIKWNPGYLLGASGGDGKGMVISSVQATGQNTSDEFIEPISGFVKSETTGKQFPILVIDNNKLVSPDGYGIPAKHQFNVAAVISDSVISDTEFLRDFGRMTFTFKYADHTYTKHFTPEELEAEV